VGSQSHRTDQGSSDYADDLCKISRFEKSQSHRTDQGSSDHQSPQQACGVQHLKMSQSHRTDQGSSDGVKRDPATICAKEESQSHRTDQGSSDSKRGSSLSPSSESRNPTVLIREVRNRSLRKQPSPRARESQSHRTDQGSSDHETSRILCQILCQEVAIPPY